MAEKSECRVLIVDDDEEFRISLTKTFAKEGYKVNSVADGFQAINSFKKETFDLVIADLRMPGKSGTELLREIKKISPDTEVIIVTAYGEMPIYLEAMSAGAFGYLDKPVKRDEILKLAAEALEKSEEIK